MSSESWPGVLSGGSVSSGGGLERIISSSSSCARSASSSSGEACLSLRCEGSGGVNMGEEAGDSSG